MPAVLMIDSCKNSDGSASSDRVLDGNVNNNCDSSLERVMNLLEKKIRNLEKRRTKLEQTRMDLKAGKPLVEDQIKALEHLSSVETQIEFAKEFLRNVRQMTTENERPDERENAAMANSAMKSAVESLPIDHLLRIQEMLRNLNKDTVKNDFRTGSNGAMLLNDDQLEILDECYRNLCPSREGSLNKTDWRSCIENSANFIQLLLKGSSHCLPEKTITFAGLRSLLDEIIALEYFENLAISNSVDPMPSDSGVSVSTLASPSTISVVSQSSPRPTTIPADVDGTSGDADADDDDDKHFSFFAASPPPPPLAAPSDESPSFAAAATTTSSDATTLAAASKSDDDDEEEEEDATALLKPAALPHDVAERQSPPLTSASPYRQLTSPPPPTYVDVMTSVAPGGGGFYASTTVVLPPPPPTTAHHGLPPPAPTGLECLLFGPPPPMHLPSDMPEPYPFLYDPMPAAYLGPANELAFSENADYGIVNDYIVPGPAPYYVENGFGTEADYFVGGCTSENFYASTAIYPSTSKSLDPNAPVFVSKQTAHAVTGISSCEYIDRLRQNHAKGFNYTHFNYGGKRGQFNDGTRARRNGLFVRRDNGPSLGHNTACYGSGVGGNGRYQWGPRVPGAYSRGRGRRRSGWCARSRESNSASPPIASVESQPEYDATINGGDIKGGDIGIKGDRPIGSEYPENRFEPALGQVVVDDSSQAQNPIDISEIDCTQSQ